VATSRPHVPPTSPPFGPRGVSAVLLLVALIAVIAETLAGFATRIEPYLSVHYDVRLELVLVSGQVLFQWCFLFRRPWEERFSYAFLVIAVSTLGAVLLWPLLLFVPTTVPRLANVAWFFAVVAVMFAAHYGLVVRHHLPKRLCLTWVVYRLFILVFVVRWR
jgi:hypothetical protein